MKSLSDSNIVLDDIKRNPLDKTSKIKVKFQRGKQSYDTLLKKFEASKITRPRKFKCSNNKIRHKKLFLSPSFLK